MFLQPQISSTMTRSWQRKLVRVAGIITKVLILNILQDLSVQEKYRACSARMKAKIKEGMATL